MSISNCIIIHYRDSNYQTSPFAVVGGTLVKLANAIHKVAKYYYYGPKRSSNKIQILKTKYEFGIKNEFNIPRYIVHCLFCNCVCPQIFRNTYLQSGLTQGGEMWQDGRSRWVAGHLLFWWTLAQGLGPKAKKWKINNALGSRRARCDKVAGQSACGDICQSR